MEALVKFLRLDIKIQKILLGLSAACILFPMAIWIVGLKLKDSTRTVYLLFSLILILLMFTIVNIHIKGDLDIWLKGAVFIVIPFITAIWYLKYSTATKDKLTDRKGEYFTELEMENILDAEELLK